MRCNVRCSTGGWGGGGGGGGDVAERKRGEEDDICLCGGWVGKCKVKCRMNWKMQK